jgi:hypothetical protein
MEITRNFAEWFDGGFGLCDDLLGEDISIGKIVGFFQAFVWSQKMSRPALSRM